MPPAEDGQMVLIVGGGAAGLSSAAALARRGVRATVLEQDEAVGGSWERRYDSLHLHTIRRFSGLAHHPIPKDRPRYLAKDDYAAYLREYAQALALDVALGERVEAVRPDGDGGWMVETSSGARQARAVVIATGHYAEPYLPELPGSETFPGELLHSSGYRSGASFQARRALVVGLGNSGAEIAADLAKHGATSVSIAVRTTPPIVTRELLGVVPVQLLGIGLTPMPAPRVVDRVGTALRRVAVGDLTAYGLGKAAWGPFTARKPAVIDVGFLAELKAGHITVRPALTGFENDAARFADGSQEAVDVVVAATGFRTGLERILQVPGLLDKTGQPRFRSARPTPAPGLYFVGFDETVRGHLFEANRDSRRLAAELERYLGRVASPS